MRRMDAGGYAARFDHQQLALMCANSDRTIDELGAENKQLKVENANLRAQYEAVIYDYRSKVAKLREFALMMLLVCKSRGIVGGMFARPDSNRNLDECVNFESRARELGVVK